MPDKVRKSHHQVVKDVRTNVDAGNDFLSGRKNKRNKIKLDSLCSLCLISRTDVLFVMGPTRLDIPYLITTKVEFRTTKLPDR